MRPDELREMTLDELMDALVEAKEERFNLRFQVATNQIDNTARLKTVKKDIARIRTILRERELAEAGSSAGAETAASAKREADAEAGAAAPERADAVSGETAPSRRRRTKEKA